MWQTMVKTVRDVDTRKVADAKEDLDTLLVFAGLFSAVVTTFAVDSYAGLQPDNTDELVFLMRQSLSQSYTFADGVLRPASPFPGQAPFEPPLWALRVNGLWFASLIVSLSTASFGMLVKQWLNEYLAMDWITPQEQLRARQFRHPGLEAWKVFEIAAMLPLLLHVSLGLFFLGLCFYTVAANETVGRSTFPLVAGWAFFALMSIVAPLASPRCPYKVALLKAALRIGRRYVTLRVRRRLGRWTYALTRTLRSMARATGAAFEGLLGSSLCCFCCPCIVTPIFLVLYPILAGMVGLRMLRRAGRAITMFFQAAHHTILASAVHAEEEDVMKQPYATHELLLSVDRFVVDNGPIFTLMTNLLKQTEAPPPSIVAFAVGCSQHRSSAPR
ncbi:hypothetical protein PsYK624_115680 [Phanerochaete sordida]|uniref:DUF6535 domain-containing protein n=1 Tax=Phanerochaete sordida TaxID=48140 RepID=A0A9P3GJG6_9APHY|nr:hypothetical protein PsYK624_115680 [Phanerochaete sordida]